MTKTEQLERLTEVVRELESLGVDILSANAEMSGDPSVHLSAYDLLKDVSLRRQGKRRRHN